MPTQEGEHHEEERDDARFGRDEIRAEETNAKEQIGDEVESQPTDREMAAAFEKATRSYLQRKEAIMAEEGCRADAIEGVTNIYI